MATDDGSTIPDRIKAERAAYAAFVGRLPPSQLLYRWRYLEDLVDALSTKQHIQVAHLRINGFEQVFNRSKREPLGVEAGLGYFLGNSAIEGFGSVLLRHLDPMRVSGILTASLYNDGPAFHLIVEDPPPGRCFKVLSGLIGSDTFRQEILREVQTSARARIENVSIQWEEGEYQRLRQELNDFTDPEVVQFYGGLSEITTGNRRRAVQLAYQVTEQAFRAAQLRQLTFATRKEFLAAVDGASQSVSQGRSRLESAYVFTAALANAKNARRSGLLQFSRGPIHDDLIAEGAQVVERRLGSRCRSVNAFVDFALSAGLARQFTPIHVARHKQYFDQETYKSLFARYDQAVFARDSRAIGRVQDKIFYKALLYRLGNQYVSYPVLRANTPFLRSLINYLVQVRPPESCGVVFERGADEVGRVVWDSPRSRLEIQKYDMNDAWSTIIQHSVAVAEHIGHEFLTILCTVPDSRQAIEAFLALNLPSVEAIYPISLESETGGDPAYDLAALRVPFGVFQAASSEGRIIETSGQYALKVQSPQLFCGGGITLSVGHLALSHKDFSYLEGLADALMLDSKAKTKRFQALNGRVDPAMAYAHTSVTLTPDQLARLPDYSLREVDRAAVEFALKRSRRAHERQIDRMRQAIADETSHDHIVVVSNSQQEAAFWKQRLEAKRGHLFKRTAQILSVCDPWARAGSGMDIGTLKAFVLAREMAWHESTIDLAQELRRGKTIAVYHGAGMGKRLYPITGVEHANKVAARVPLTIGADGVAGPQTVLEAVIFSTAIFAPSRPGRLAVFHGDQIVIPSDAPIYDGRHHVEYLSRPQEIWPENDSGTIMVNATGDLLFYVASLADHIVRLTFARSKTGAAAKTALSLGSYTLSWSFLEKLLDGVLPHLESDRVPPGYLPLMPRLVNLSRSGQGVPPGEQTAMEQAVRSSIPDWLHRFLCECGTSLGDQPLFGIKDVGDAYFWDLGQLRSYWETFLRLVEQSSEGDVIRYFFGLRADDDLARDSRLRHVDLSHAVAQRSTLRRGRARHSVMVEFDGEDVDVENSLVIGGCIGTLTARDALIYNVTDESVEADGEVVADVLHPVRGRIRLRAPLNRPLGGDGKLDWNVRIGGNAYSYEEISRLWQT